ncbi:Hydrocephalus-inducing protein, partial [Exaiptasia diaphana]
AIEDKDEDEGIGDVGYGSQDEKSEENGSSNGSSRQMSRPVSAQQWAAASDPLFNIGIDEVFDILPLYSTIRPMETQKLQFTFY